MKQDVKATNITLTRAISRYIKEKVTYLERFIDKNDESARASIEVEKTTDRHNKGVIFRAEINLHVAGKNFRAESTQEDLYVAIDDIKDEMSAELKKFKGKRETMKRRGGRTAKKILKRGK